MVRLLRLGEAMEVVFRSLRSSEARLRPCSPNDAAKGQVRSTLGHIKVVEAK